MQNRIFIVLLTILGFVLCTFILLVAYSLGQNSERGKAPEDTGQYEAVEAVPEEEYGEEVIYEEPDYESVDYDNDDYDTVGYDNSAYVDSNAKEGYLSAYSHVVDAANQNYPDTSYYALFDMDHDGIEELIVREGTCEADYEFVFYTYQDGEVIRIGSAPGGHTALVSDVSDAPVTHAGNLYGYYGHMDHTEFTQYNFDGSEFSAVKITDYGDPDSYYQIQETKTSSHSGLI